MPKPSSIADYARLFASRGGKARKKALTPEERSTIARKAARARWRATSREERREIARRTVRACWAKEQKKQ